MANLLVDGPANAPRTIVLAHGAGAGMTSPFMAAFAEGLAQRNFRVVRFNFPYMAKAEAVGRRRPPDRAPVLRDHWLEIIETLGIDGLLVGGKSLGGRIASTVADHPAVAGLVCLGYPFHPPGKPERLRVAHLVDFEKPGLICQGERDPFGNATEVPGYGLSKSISLHWLPDCDHDFKPRVKSGRSSEQNWRSVMDEVARFSQNFARVTE